LNGFKKARDEIRRVSREIYKGLPNPFWVTCLSENIIFNSQGFNHLLYDGRGRKRSDAEERHKLLLIPFIPHVLLYGNLPIIGKG
jgi:hypothetical protein